MSLDEEPPFRNQLINARTRIVAQLDEVHYRAGAGVGGSGGPPNYSEVVAELEGELRDINELLGAEDAGDAGGASG
jgi:hypothetical protein